MFYFIGLLLDIFLRIRKFHFNPENVEKSCKTITRSRGAGDNGCEKG